MSEVFEPLAESEPQSGDAYRGAVLEALRGAAKRGWLGPMPEVERDPTAAVHADRLNELDRLALSIRSALERVALPVARAARALVDAHGWVQFGHARIDDYARERLGRTGRWVRDQAAVGRALESFVALAAAVAGEDGGQPLGRLRALLVGRVASAESVAAWIELARNVSVRELKEIVKQALRRGDVSPPEEIGSSPEEHSARTEASKVGIRAGEILSSPNTRDAFRIEVYSDDTRSCRNTNASASEREDLGVSGELVNEEDPSRAETVGSRVTEECADLDERCRLRMAVPMGVRAAFDEALCLHRAVSGRETSVTSFIEALVAEAHAGPRPPEVDPEVDDVDRVCFVRRPGAQATLEQRLAIQTRSWARLHDGGEPESVSALASGTLARFEAIARRAGQGDVEELDRQLAGLIELEDELERRLGRLLSELQALRAWRRLSFAGLRHYAEQRLGLGRTAAESRARLARWLERYPQLAVAYEQGRVGMEAAWIVVRILNETDRDSETERAWVERASEATVKRMRDELRVLCRRQAIAERTAPAMPLDDATWHGSLMQRPGQIRARVHELASRAVASGCSDVFLRLNLPEDVADDFLAAVESARRGLTEQATVWCGVKEHTGVREDVTEQAATRGAVAGDMPDARGGVGRGSLQAARMFSAFERSVPSWVGLLAMLEDFVETWDRPEAMPRRRAEEVYAREGWRCFAPACTSRCQLEDHHLEYLSRGGARKAKSNRLCLCRFHHRQGEHGTLARCRGQAPLDVLWRLGRADLGVWFRNERRLERTATTAGVPRGAHPRQTGA